MHHSCADEQHPHRHLFSVNFLNTASFSVCLGRKYARCSMCCYATYCGSGYAAHTMSLHAGRATATGCSPAVKERPMDICQRCPCGFTSHFGNRMGRFANVLTVRFCRSTSVLIVIYYMLPQWQDASWELLKTMTNRTVTIGHRCVRCRCTASCVRLFVVWIFCSCSGFYVIVCTLIENVAVYKSTSLVARKYFLMKSDWVLTNVIV